MRKTIAMKGREKEINVVWKDEGDGFFSGIGNGYSMVAYIKIPKDHPDAKKGYDDLNPDVNGGLTFARDLMFGWDYGHYENDMDVEKHIKNALEYFKKRYKKDASGRGNE